MNQLQWEIIVQVSTYFLVLVMAVGALALIFKGLFWQYIRVRTSLGRLVLVKIRSVNRDFFRVGRVEESMLVFKGTTGMKRISVESKDSFYRSLNVNWVDIDEEKNCIIKPDMTGITGFDAEKYENLYLRALYRPESVNKKEIIIIILLLEYFFERIFFKQNISQDGQSQHF